MRLHLLRHLSMIALLLSAVIIMLMSQFTHLDLMIEDYYFDQTTQTFVWKNTWFAKDFMHNDIKKIITAFGGAWLCITCLDVLYPLRNIDNLIRLRLRLVAIAAVLVPLLITILKRMSALHCPWDVQRYGGNAPYLRLLDTVPQGVNAGHCFPAGHASTGLWLAALCVFWLPHRPKIARLVFLTGLSVGFLLGWVQQMRGAHFLSHTLWSMWLASLVIVLLIKINQTKLEQHAYNN